MNNSLQLFPSPVFSTIIEEDTSEMDISNFNLDDRGSFNLVLNNKLEVDWRVLKKYPHVEQIILNKFKEVCDNVLHYTQDFIITTSWITEMKKGGSIDWHSHKNSFYSGIYYFKTYDTQSGSIIFDNPLRDIKDYYIFPEKQNFITAETWEIFPKNKNLIFFPSYLRHKVLSHKSDFSRYSLACNICPIGSYGERDNMIDTSWYK